MFGAPRALLAEGLREAGEGRRAADADEEIEVLRLPPQAVLESTRDAKTLLAALLVERRQRSGAGPETPVDTGRVPGY